MDTVQDDVVKIRDFVMTEQSQRVLDWITELDFNGQHNDNLKQRLDGTGAWFLESAEFNQWIDQPQQTLYCPGIPGAGKTIMSSTVIEHLKGKFQDSPGVQIAYLFCSYQPSHRQSTFEFVLSLLRQLAVKSSAILPNIEEMYYAYNRNGRHLDLKEALSELSKTVRSFKRVFVVIDALDEFCSSSPNELQELLSVGFMLQEETGINILATSRPNSEIMSRFEGCIQREIRAQDDDILGYVNTEIPGLLRSRISLHPEVEDDVRRAFVQNADGMYVPITDLATRLSDFDSGFY